MPLLKSLTLSNLTFIGLGDIFSAGIFVLITQCIQYSGENIYWVFLFITTLIMISGLSYCEISDIYPDNTAEQQAIRDGIHPIAGRISNFLIYFYGIATTSTILVSIAKYLETNYHENKNRLTNSMFSGIFRKYDKLEKNGYLNPIITTILLVVMTVWNLSGIQVSKKIIQSIIVILISLLSILFVGGFSKNPLTIPKNTFPSKSSNFILASVLFIFLYDGYDSIIKMKEEAINQKDVPYAILLSIIISSCLYFICIYLGRKWMSFTEITKSITYIPSLFSKIFGNSYYSLILLIGLIIMLNSSFISYLATTRYLYGVAHDHYDLEHHNNKLKNIGENKDNREIQETLETNHLGLLSPTKSSETNHLGLLSPTKSSETNNHLTWKQWISMWIQELNRNNVPWKTILFTSFVIFLLNMKKNEVYLALFTDLSMILILLMINLSVIFLRYKNTDSNSNSIDSTNFKVPLNIGKFPILPAIAVITFTYILYYTIRHKIWREIV
jgi:APA family basic amino acid/polyamine antiporter